MGGLVHRLIRETTGNEDPYRDAKDLLNRRALELYPRLEETVTGSEDPLETAVRLAIAGNIIDFAVTARVEQSHIQDAIEYSLVAPLASESVDGFRKAMARAEDILYLADNAGEIVFDRLLIGQLPREKITLVVKARPVINDATYSDARDAGLTGMVDVIDNGSDVPGTILATCSDSFRRRFERADVIVSKGQGNYESLSDVPKNIFFLFKAKCSAITLHLGCEPGSLVLQGHTPDRAQSRFRDKSHVDSV